MASINYCINPNAITITPNSLYGKGKYVYVGVAAQSKVRLAAKFVDMEGLVVNVGYNNSLNYNEWLISLCGGIVLSDDVEDKDVYVYLRIPKDTTLKAMFMFSPTVYDIVGKYEVEEGDEPAAVDESEEVVEGEGDTSETTIAQLQGDYYYIRIATLKVNNDTNKTRTLTDTDFGELDTNQGKDNKNTGDFDKAFHWVNSIGNGVLQMIAPLFNILFRNQIDGNQSDATVVSIQNIFTSAYSWVDSHISDTALATTKWIKQFFISKATDDDNNGHKLTVGTLAVQPNEEDNNNPGAYFGDEYEEETKGAAIYRDADGNWHGVFDFITARHALKAKEIDIQEVYYIGGQQVSSAAGCRISLVAPLTDGYYRCYFSKRDDSGRVVRQQWKVYDQAYCNTFNLAEGSQYYWRLVVGVSNGTETGTFSIDDVEYNAADYHYIDLSDYHKVGSYVEAITPATVPNIFNTAPKADDAIVLMGHYTLADITGLTRTVTTATEKAERQCMIITAGGGNGAPYILEIVGVHKFSFDGSTTAVRLKPNDNYFAGTLEIGPSSVIKGDGDTQINVTQLIGLPDSMTNLTNSQQSIEETVNNLAQNKVNMLRNSGFTGDYLSLWIASHGEVDNSTEVYSPSLEHWDAESATTYNVDAIDGVEPRIAVALANGKLSQKLYYRLLQSTQYSFSVYAHAIEGQTSSITIKVGDYEHTIDVTSTAWQRYTINGFQSTKQGDIFEISGTAFILAPQLEKGGVVTAWTMSVLDNTTQAAIYENLENVRRALGQKTQTNGGLVLTSTIGCGYSDEPNFTWDSWECTAGMNGLTDKTKVVDDSIAFWAGGNMSQAIKLRNLYAGEKASNTYTDEYIAQQGAAAYAVTHDGRVIMHDAIVRGNIYATNGYFHGTVVATDGEFTGKVTLSNKGITINIDTDDAGYPNISLISNNGCSVKINYDVTLQYPTVHIKKGVYASLITPDSVAISKYDNSGNLVSKTSSSSVRTTIHDVSNDKYLQLGNLPDGTFDIYKKENNSYQRVNWVND